MGQAHPQPQGEKQRETEVEIQVEGAPLGVREGLKYQYQKVRESQNQTQRKILARQIKEVEEAEGYLKKQDFIFHEC